MSSCDVYHLLVVLSGEYSYCNDLFRAIWYCRQVVAFALTADDVERVAKDQYKELLNTESTATVLVLRLFDPQVCLILKLFSSIVNVYARYRDSDH